MATLPTIPTSFVPHQASAGARRVQTDFGNAFSVAAYGMLALSFLAMFGVFFYGRILAGDLAARDTELAKAEAAIDPVTIESFIQLRDRLDSSKQLLANHVAVSGLFAALEQRLPTTVRFSSFHVVVDPKGATIEGTGISRSFNALAFASESFATDGRFKDIIFSKMSLNKDSSVSFNFSSSLDSRLLAFSPSLAEQPAPAETAAPVATTTPTL